MDWSKAADEAQTLMQAHEALSRLMPRPNANTRTWAEYHRRSAAIYAKVAEIDRGHFHETMFVRHEALDFRMEVEDLHRRVVAAA